MCIMLSAYWHGLFPRLSGTALVSSEISESFNPSFVNMWVECQTIWQRLVKKCRFSNYTVVKVGVILPISFMSRVPATFMPQVFEYSIHLWDDD